MVKSAQHILVFIILVCNTLAHWSPWSAWTNCSATCDGGTTLRVRHCESTPTTCTGSPFESRECGTSPCQSDAWSPWSPWTNCSVTCGGGMTMRVRHCETPQLTCSGAPYETTTCGNVTCPSDTVNGEWGAWTQWGGCSAECGLGLRARQRTCDSPAPKNGGKACAGMPLENSTCTNTADCSIDGGWSAWQDWTSCFKTCGNSTKARQRTCDNPIPLNGGNTCLGNSLTISECNLAACLIDGGWSAWQDWTSCVQTCGNSSKTRQRTCDNPQPLNGGNSCPGVSTMHSECLLAACAIDGGWGDWADWSSCNATCGGGLQHRSRSCDNPVPDHGGTTCNGIVIDQQQCGTSPCPIDGGWSAWQDWTSCVQTCGNSSKTRQRTCDNPQPLNGGNSCPGVSTMQSECILAACAIDGGWGDWADWSSCNATCGGGLKQRSRSCDNPVPDHGGTTCNGTVIDQQQCGTSPCPIDGSWGDWIAWSSCIVTCGSGHETRVRTCNNPAPLHGGHICKGVSIDARACDLAACPIDGGWEEWTPWTACTATCGAGHNARMRLCTNPAPKNGGNKCEGSSIGVRTCVMPNCPIDGGWSAWKEWTLCSKTCGFGVKARHRTCDEPFPQYGGNNCSDTAIGFSKCHQEECPIDGGWGAWAEWTPCSKTCDTGLKERNRTCDNPRPQYGGNDCSDSATHVGTCHLAVCPIDGGWDEWTTWTSCSVTCGDGLATTTRICNNPAPAHGGHACAGNSSVERTCNASPCPIDGGWGEWAIWSSCNVTCGGGQETRNRTCDQPAPVHGGKECNGTAVDARTCGVSPCIVDGGWGGWNPWSACSQTCGLGVKKRHRSCDTPEPANGGHPCPGTFSTTTTCHLAECPVDGGWGEWAIWSSCNVTCGGGQETRNRTCNQPAPVHGGKVCNGTAEDARSCGVSPCTVDGGWGGWNPWSACSQTCGLGVKKRHRSCDTPEPANGGHPCPGTFSTTTTCHLAECPVVDGGWGEWEQWTSCSETCGLGVKKKRRSCDNPEPANGGHPCPGTFSTTTTCQLADCPVDGGWDDWTSWTSCSVTCGGGLATRARACTNPAPEHGGKTCVGNTTDIRTCGMSNCSVDGDWFQWTNWTDCGVVCGDGHTVRTRTCLNPAPAGAGANCTGPSKERQPCNKGNCTNVTTICKDDDLLQMTRGTPPITDPTQSPYTACHSPKSVQELLLGKMCKVSSHAADWTLGTALVEDCGTVPLYSPLALVDKQTHDRTYAILLDCYNDVIQIIDIDCRMKVQVVPLNHTSTDYHMLLM